MPQINRANIKKIKIKPKIKLQGLSLNHVFQAHFGSCFCLLINLILLTNKLMENFCMLNCTHRKAVTFPLIAKKIVVYRRRQVNRFHSIIFLIIIICTFNQSFLCTFLCVNKFLNSFLAIQFHSHQINMIIFTCIIKGVHVIEWLLYPPTPSTLYYILITKFEM